MRCFVHPDREAVAICRTCATGICRECGVDVGSGFACSAKCAEDVRRYLEFYEQSLQSQKPSIQEICIAVPSPQKFISQDQRLMIQVGALEQASQRTVRRWAWLQFFVGTLLVGWGTSTGHFLTVQLMAGACFIAYGIIVLRTDERQRQAAKAKPNDSSTA